MKKKLLSLYLSIIMLLGLVIPITDISYADTNNPIDLSIVSVKNYDLNKDAEIMLQAHNTDNKDASVYLVNGLYNRLSEELVSYYYVMATIPSGESVQWGSCIPMPSEGDYYIKSFTWDSIESPELLSNVIKVNQSDETPINIKPYLNKAIEYQLENNQTPGVGFVGGEWTIFGLARSNAKVPDDYYETYYRTVVNAVHKEDAKTENVFSNKVTDPERISLALTAIGANPEDVEGVNLLNYIWNKEEHFPGIDRPELGDYQGLNELDFALLAFDTKNYQQPDTATKTRDEIINKIINDFQKTDGGFGLSKDSDMSGIDMTAMTLQALAPYYNSHQNVKISVDGIINYLSEQQSNKGWYDHQSYGISSESISQVIVGLSAMGIDAHTDERFNKDGNSLIEALLEFRDPASGAFRHTLNDDVNQMATDQATYAMIAYDRLKSGQTSLYDMSDVEFKNYSATPPETTYSIQTSLEDYKEYDTASLTFDANVKKSIDDMNMNLTPTSVELNGEKLTKTEDKYNCTLRPGNNQIRITYTNEKQNIESLYHLKYLKEIGNVVVFINDVADRTDENATVKTPLGTILGPENFKLYQDDTVEDVLRRNLSSRGIESSWSGRGAQAYLAGINNLKEFAGGSSSGWMYTVNGYPPSFDETTGKGIGQCILEDKDFVHLGYTCTNMGADIGMGFLPSKTNIVSDVIVGYGGNEIALDGGFNPNNLDYTLTLPTNTSDIKIRLEQISPKGSGVTSIVLSDQTYKFWETIPVENNSLITIKDSSNTYTIKIVIKSGVPKASLEVINGSTSFYDKDDYNLIENELIKDFVIRIITSKGGTCDATGPIFMNINGKPSIPGVGQWETSLNGRKLNFGEIHSLKVSADDAIKVWYVTH